MSSTNLTESLWPELPESYGRDYLVVLMCNPNKVYAFWEFCGPELSLALRRLPMATNSSDQLLFLDNLTGDQRVGSVYLEVPSGNQIRLELGVWDEERFQPRILSNTLLLPNSNGKVSEFSVNNLTTLCGYPLHIKYN